MAQDDQAYTQLLERLRSHSYRDVCTALANIRTLLQDKTPVRVATKLRTTGITKVLVKIIHKKYSRILSLALSVLSTCALELETRILLLKQSVPELLMKIMRETESDSVLSRVCRFVGNLGGLPAASAEFHACGAVALLLKLIEISETNKSSSETKQMAIRALRVLGDTRENRSELMRQEVVKHIAAHLASADESLVKCTLKTLNSFSSTTEGALQIMSSNSAQGFENLVRLTKDGPSSELAVSCICNLANVEAVRPDLGKVGAITVIFNELKKTSSKSEPRALITALDRFCCECVNRIRIKDNDHFGDLLDLYRSTRFVHLHDIVLRALGRYMYDEKSLMQLVQLGMVRALVCKVRHYIRTLLPAGHAFQPQRYNLCVDSDSDIERSPSPQRSPPHGGPVSPTASSSCMSPPRSPSLSGWSPAYSTTSSAAADNYSPVYDESSDDDDDDCLALLGSDDEDGASIAADKCGTETRDPYVSCIFRMLHHISTYDWATTEMVTPPLVNTLIAYLISGDLYSEASNTLCNVMKRHEFLLPLVQQRYAILVYSKLGVWKHTGDCKICRSREKSATQIFTQMTQMSDSACARGELSYLLQKGSEKDKVSVALSIPYIVRTVSNLKELLLDKEQKGLSVLLELIENDSECSAAVQSTCVLSRCLQITFSAPTPSETPLFDSYTPRPEPPSNIVTFKLDDDSLVRADKTALAEASEVFSSMLFGSFQESKQDLVRLKEISKASLILFLLYCKSYVGEYEFTIGKPEVVDVLDLLLLSDRFLVLELNAKVKDYIKTKYFDSENLAPLIKWCHEKMDLDCGENVEIIYNDACAFLLSGNMDQQQRVLIFKSILREPEMWQRLKTCISSLLAQKLQRDFKPDFRLKLRFNYKVYEPSTPAPTIAVCYTGPIEASDPSPASSEIIWFGDD